MKDILLRTATRVERRGLARRRAVEPNGAFCLAAGLVESATYGNPQRFHEKDYTAARNALCSHLGIASSYDALVDWNDDSFVTKKGEARFKHSNEDTIKALRETAAKPVPATS